MIDIQSQMICEFILCEEITFIAAELSDRIYIIKLNILSAPYQISF